MRAVLGNMLAPSATFTTCPPSAYLSCLHYKMIQTEKKKKEKTDKEKEKIEGFMPNHFRGLAYSRAMPTEEAVSSVARKRATKDRKIFSEAKLLYQRQHDAVAQESHASF